MAWVLAWGAWTGWSAQPGRGDSASSAPQRARVVIVDNPRVMDRFKPVTNEVPGMVQRGLTVLTGTTNEALAWRSLVTTQDTVGIKVFSSPGPLSGTRPAVVEALVQGLMAAGVPGDQIIIWDRQAVHLRLAGFYELARRLGVRVESSVDAGYDPAYFYETALLGQLVDGDLEFGQQGQGVGRKSFFSKLITQKMTKLIAVSPLLNHNVAGVSGNLFSLTLGGVDNTLRFESSHSRLAEAVPEIAAVPVLSDRLVLCVIDALICQYEGEERQLLHYSTMLNQLWFSRDPVALDVLAIRELERQRQSVQSRSRRSFADLYDNAALLELGVSSLRQIDVVRPPSL
jgi:hypothetical protein